ncbi:C2H2 finger domain transcription factor mtfA [Mycena kentingensis (nom. inval.)]|nr:C2H2 finger domain transcription factor mtfA [Mycena kentingensis (nom. inval.)]
MTTAHPVVLPSINELFPEHLLRVPHHAPLPLPAPPIAELQHHRASNSSGRARPHAPLHKPYSRPSVRAPTSYSFDVLKSDPYNVSLTHIASSAANASARPQSQAPSDGSGGADELEDADADPDGDDPGAARKHVCATCQKRFNRPSSLRIHMNVHSGATPYRCPHPGCGRAFNVSSNMRRHLRNHAPAPRPHARHYHHLGCRGARKAPLPARSIPIDHLHLTNIPAVRRCRSPPLRIALLRDRSRTTTLDAAWSPRGTSAGAGTRLFRERCAKPEIALLPPDPDTGSRGGGYAGEGTEGSSRDRLDADTTFERSHRHRGFFAGPG